MAIEYRTSGTTKKCILTACPICGFEFPSGAGQVRSLHFVNEHTPEDFGLTRVDLPDIEWEKLDADPY